MIRVTLAFGVVFALIGEAPVASATVDGPCTASFNGVESKRIDSLNSPMELEAGDVLTFQGTDDTGTQGAKVEVILAMITVREGSTVYGPLQNDFSASLDLDDVSPYGVGLYRVRGVTDNCSVAAWVRISGRFPFTTLIGLTAGGMALGGLAAQLTAIATRRRKSAWLAALAGIVTGVGSAGIGQQFGRMQLSIPSILIVVAITALLGALVALLLAPRQGAGWIAGRRASRAQKRAIRYQARLEAARLDAERREAEASATTVTQTAAVPGADATARAAPAPNPAATPSPTTPDVPAALTQPNPAPAPTSAPAAIEGPAWCYVLAPVDVFDLAEHTQAIGMLQPGSWYLAKRQVGGWAQVAVGDGVEGWVAQSAIHTLG